jgi:hypothetical protein
MYKAIPHLTFDKSCASCKHYRGDLDWDVVGQHKWCKYALGQHTENLDPKFTRCHLHKLREGAMEEEIESIDEDTLRWAKG